MKSTKRLGLSLDHGRKIDYQWISCFHCFFKISFISLKWLFQKNPLCAENGDGWGDSRIKCLSVSISTFFHLAKFPHRTNIIHSWDSESFCKTASVNSAHQHFAWLAGLDFSTVRILLSKRIPCSAQWVKFQLVGVSLVSAHSHSASISLYIFLRLGGILTPSCTEKLSPWACPSPW